ncbi:MAG: ribosome maturation factor RimM [Lentimicrobiaceae bacterium]|nr:ribosome maturation factor RimM [Lentimicrobiaceae bacterium]
MNIQDCFYLGKITKTSGTKGEVVFFLDVDDINSYRNLSSVFIDLNGDLVPFFIEKISFQHTNNATVSLTDINTTDQAGILVNMNLYLPLHMLPPLQAHQFYYHEVIGYKVIDYKNGETGIVQKVLEYPHQAILSISFLNKEILIPVADEIITRIDKENKTLYIKSPEGLIDIYL